MLVARCFHFMNSSTNFWVQPKDKPKDKRTFMTGTPEAVNFIFEASSLNTCEEYYSMKGR